MEKRMISEQFVEQLFKTSTIQRWTDHIRPLDLTALGKHAHMLTIAWVLGRRAETESPDLWRIDWDYLIRGSLYELLRVSVLTDLKSPVQDELKKKPEIWKEINEYVVKVLHKKIPDLPEWFWTGMEKYFDDEHSNVERGNAHVIIRAASALATAWEFRIVEQANPFLRDLANTKTNVEETVRCYQYVPAVLDIHQNRNELGRFTDLCGRLRFQLRWSQTPILPTRPVLDHELVVGYLSYLQLAREETAYDSIDMWQRYHAFFGALFHDLPEVLTRDIISPTKTGVPGLDDVIAEIEGKWFEDMFMPMLPKRLYHELRFFAIGEFDEKKWPPADWPSYLEETNPSRTHTLHPGGIIKACDKFAGFMEAYYSCSFGVFSNDLFDAIEPENTSPRAELNKKCNFGPLYSYFIDRP